MALHREWIMEKTQKFQKLNPGPTNLCQHITADLARGIMTNVNNLRRRRHDLSNILKWQAAFLYSPYHQRAGKSQASLFHMRGVDFTHFDTCCTFNTILFQCRITYDESKLSSRVNGRYDSNGPGLSIYSSDWANGLGLSIYIQLWLSCELGHLGPTSYCK